MAISKKEITARNRELNRVVRKITYFHLNDITS
jgi:hypothetical protein